MRTRFSLPFVGFGASAIALVAYAICVLFTPTPNGSPAFIRHRKQVLSTYPLLSGGYGYPPAYESLEWPSRLFVTLHLVSPPLIVTSLLFEAYPHSPFLRDWNARRSPGESLWRHRTRERLHELWCTDGRFLLQALLLSGLWWTGIARGLPKWRLALSTLGWRGISRRFLRRTLLVVPLGFIGTLAVLSFDINDILDERVRREILLEQAERGRLRADSDIRAGRLAWPDPCPDEFLASEWCRLYGIECRYEPPSNRVLGGCFSSTSEARLIEPDTYQFFMRAHLRRVVGQEGLEFMRSLQHFTHLHGPGGV